MHDCIQNMAARVSVLASTKELVFYLTCQIWQQFGAGTLVPQGQGNRGELLYGVQSQLRSREGKRDWTMNTYNHLTRLYLDTTTGFLALTVYNSGISRTAAGITSHFRKRRFLQVSGSRSSLASRALLPERHRSSARQ